MELAGGIGQLLAAVGAACYFLLLLWYQHSRPYLATRGAGVAPVWGAGLQPDRRCRFNMLHHLGPCLPSLPACLQPSTALTARGAPSTCNSPARCAAAAAAAPAVQLLLAMQQSQP